ncbi:MAG: polysulfide reductase NrfD [Thermodesulfovibrionales bacterium]|nr:polysulfide reductase NrfD [Thermodesulfovibrionales bacterium]
MISKIETIDDKTSCYYIGISLLLSLMFLGVYAAVMSYVGSMEMLEFHISIPWTMMISTYVFFVASSIGLCIVASLGYVFGLNRYKIISKRGTFLAVITIIFGMLNVLLHLGHPERAPIYTTFTPNFRSAMWGIGFFYNLYIPLIMLTCWLLIRADLAVISENSTGWRHKLYALASGKKWLKSYNLQRFTGVIGAGSLCFGLLALAVEGSLFGHVEAREYWYGADIPVYFIFSSIHLGIAWLIFMTIITYKFKGEEMGERLKKLMLEMGKIFIILLSVSSLFITYKVYAGSIDAMKAKTVMLYIKGALSIPFWIFEMAIGTILPIVVLLFAVQRESLNGLLTAAVMVLAGAFVMKYDFVVAGQVFPVFKKAPLMFPAFMEILLIAGIGAAFFSVYMLAERFLPLKEAN